MTTALVEEPHRDVTAVMRECARWGIDVRVVDEVTERFGCPAHALVGCSVRGRWVQVAARGLAGPDVAPALLHEMAHVVVRTPVNDVDEIGSGMLFLEHEAARRLGLAAWSDWMHNYQIGVVEFVNWGDAEPKERTDALNESLAGAMRRRLVDKMGRLRYPALTELVAPEGK